jgi:hypothetical protein
MRSLRNSKKNCGASQKSETADPAQEQYPASSLTYKPTFSVCQQIWPEWPIFTAAPVVTAPESRVWLSGGLMNVAPWLGVGLWCPNANSLVSRYRRMKKDAARSPQAPSSSRRVSMCGASPQSRRHTLKPSTIAAGVKSWYVGPISVQSALCYVAPSGGFMFVRIDAVD